MSYYVVETEWVGSPSESICEPHRVEIVTDEPRTNMSREVRVAGWLGTTNDWCVTAHGEFGSVEDARVYINAQWSVVRECEEIEEWSDVLERYYIGYAPLSRGGAIEWCADGFRAALTAQSSDEAVRAEVDEYERDLNGDGATLEPWLDRCVEAGIDYRDSLREQS